MWEWSNQTPKNKMQEATSLLDAYDDLTSVTPLSGISHQFSAVSSPEKNIEDSVPGLEEMQNLLQKKIEKYNLRNMQLIKKDYSPQTWQEMYSIFNEYQRTRNAFLKLIGYSNAKECERLGLSQYDIELLKDNIAPENYNTHLKIPFDFGGNLSLSNFSLVKTHHTHSNLHRIMDMQIAGGFLLKHKKIFIPWFEGKFYYD